jgi:hypothetical protein
LVQGRSMPNHKRQRGLTRAQEATLAREVVAFLKWLKSIGIPLVADGKYTYALLRQAKREDWVMWVKRPEKKEVQFNTYLITQCSFDYFLTVILHECFHLFVHDLPNKSDAKRFRDDFGDDLMRLLDIEADFFVADYLRHQKGYSLVQVFNCFYEGSSIFGDPKTRIGKLERFVGSVLSIAYAHYKKTRPGQRKLFLPTIQNILTEGSLHVLTVSRDAIALSDIDATTSDFIELNRSYTQAKKMRRHAYVEQLVHFAAKALKAKVPRKITKDLAELDAQPIA